MSTPPQGGQELLPEEDGMGGLFQLGTDGGRRSWALVQVPFLPRIQILGAACRWEMPPGLLQEVGPGLALNHPVLAGRKKEPAITCWAPSYSGTLNCSWKSQNPATFLVHLKHR